MSLKPASAKRFGILFVCTANLCRSPTAEMILRRLLPLEYGPAASRFDISSAGVNARPGLPMDPMSLAALGARGLAGEAAEVFRTRGLTPDIAHSADLVLTASRAHRRFVVQTAPEALGNTFCLLEFARLMASLRGAALPADPIDRFHAAVAAARDQRGLIPPVPRTAEEIRDPRDGLPKVYDETLLTIHNALVEAFGIPAPVTPVAAGDSRKRRFGWRDRPTNPPQINPAAPGPASALDLPPMTPPGFSAPDMSTLGNPSRTAAPVSDQNNLAGYLRG